MSRDEARKWLLVARETRLSGRCSDMHVSSRAAWISKLSMLARLSSLCGQSKLSFVARADVLDVLCPSEILMAVSINWQTPCSMTVFGA